MVVEVWLLGAAMMPAAPHGQRLRVLGLGSPVEGLRRHVLGYLVYTGLRGHGWL